MIWPESLLKSGASSNGRCTSRTRFVVCPVSELTFKIDLSAVEQNPENAKSKVARSRNPFPTPLYTCPFMLPEIMTFQAASSSITLDLNLDRQNSTKFSSSIHTRIWNRDPSNLCQFPQMFISILNFIPISQ